MVTKWGSLHKELAGLTCAPRNFFRGLPIGAPHSRLILRKIGNRPQERRELVKRIMCGQLAHRAFGIALAALAVLTAFPSLAADKVPQPVNLDVSQMRAGGFVFDKGTRLEKDPRLKISFTPMYETFRSQAPLNVNVRIQWTGTGLLAGHILCDMYAYQRYIGSWRSDEIVANQETLEFPLTLPSSPLYNERDLFDLRIAFETDDRTILMDPRDLPIESHWSRNYVVGVVTPENVTRIAGFRSDKKAPQIADIFQIANFHDLTVHAAQLVTNTAPIVTRELPLDPIRYTAFDLVVVSPESLREIRTAQWQALATWIRAGGRVCLVATQPVPESLRPAWRELFNERSDATQLTFSEKGIPQFAEGGTSQLFRVGCGRVLCLTEAADIESKNWLADVLWLYGVREKPRSDILNQGKWIIGPVQQEPLTFHPLAPAKRPLSALREPLNSPHVGRVSPLMILMLLGTCLLLIGPVDYYVLGRLGMRKLTWVFLPCVALATTWATMRVSQSALGATDYSRSVSVADLDSVGRVCRVSRIEQRYAGREGVEVHSLTSPLRVDFERSLLGWNTDTNPLVPEWEGDAPSNQPPVRYVGKVTGGYDVLEPMYQWSPRLFRETTFGDDPRVNSKGLSSINWSEMRDTTWRTEEGRTRILELVHAAIPEARVFVRFLGKTYNCEINPPPDAAPSNSQFTPPGDSVKEPYPLIKLIADATSSPRSRKEGGSGWYDPQYERPLGLFGLVRDRAPTAGADLEDFQWIDDEDETEAVLFIFIEGEDSVIFRQRLERPKDPSTPPTASQSAA
ncbi:hypothetical protein AYO47_04265 [Planctomyces sp. SCGC AG-212-M04]|nr:hypothetical protein AYO47_04265 [Planctomyces sp. SCGC AG-212-M04]